MMAVYQAVNPSDNGPIRPITMKEIKEKMDLVYNMSALDERELNLIDDSPPNSPSGDSDTPPPPMMPSKTFDLPYVDFGEFIEEKGRSDSPPSSPAAIRVSRVDVEDRSTVRPESVAESDVSDGKDASISCRKLILELNEPVMKRGRKRAETVTRQSKKPKERESSPLRDDQSEISNVSASKTGKKPSRAVPARKSTRKKSGL